MKRSLTCALPDPGSFLHSVPTELALEIVLPELCKPDIPPVVLQRPAVEVAVKTCEGEKKPTKTDWFSSLPILSWLISLGSLCYMLCISNSLRCMSPRLKQQRCLIGIGSCVVRSSIPEAFWLTSDGLSFGQDGDGTFRHFLLVEDWWDFGSPAVWTHPDEMAGLIG